MSFDPLPGVSYKIQNVDFATYLEFRTVDQKIQVVTRPLKNAPSQEWLFVKTPTNGQYKIQNVAPGPHRRNDYLSANGTQILGTTALDTAKSWSIEKTTDNDKNYLLTFPVGANDTYVYLSDDGQPNLKSSDDMISSENLSNNYRWRIFEAEPALPRTFLLPKGTYRIRNLANLIIHISPGSDIVSTKNQGRSANQAWEVQPTGNGNCIIKNSAENSYLGWVADTHGLPSVRKTSTPQAWQLLSLGGGYIYSVSMTYIVGGATLTLALSLGDNSELLLTPRKYTYNQIWFFEDVDGAKLPAAGGGRYPEVPQAEYYIRNCGSDKSFIAIWPAGAAPYRVGPWPNIYNRWALEYEGATSARFTLTYKGYGSFTIANNHMVLDTTAEKWILERSDTDSTRYFICLASNVDKVLSGNLTKDANNFDRFRIEDKQKDSASQLWTFNTT